MTEDDLIANYFVPIAGPAALGLKDDTALYAPPVGHELVLTVDALVEGVHFFSGDPPESIARKALRVNLSDLAAKGAEPQGFLLTLALRAGIKNLWIEHFAKALGQDAAAYGCPLIGGDTVSTPGPLMISITMMGCVPNGQMVRRTGAQAGDRIYVSGTIGDAALGLYAHGQAPPAWVNSLSQVEREYLIARYLEPQPRLALAPVLRAFAHGGMDVSDGFAGDAAKMMRASNAAARIELARVPLSKAARMASADASAFEIAVTGGDDYEILCTIPFDKAAAFEQAAAGVGVVVTCIGDVIEGRAGDVAFIDGAGAPRLFTRASYSHF